MCCVDSLLRSYVVQSIKPHNKESTRRISQKEYSSAVRPSSLPSSLTEEP